MLVTDPEPTVSEGTCEDCGQPMTRTWGYVYRDGEAYTVYYATCYDHGGHEVWIDVIFSPSWADGVDDHVSFGCRVGAVEGESEPAASLVAAATAWEDSDLFGHKLSREEALADPRLPEFWEVVDHVLTHDRVVSEHLYGEGGRSDA